ncbi:MAG: PAS domain S-box protein [Pirellulales bacterium]
MSDDSDQQVADQIDMLRQRVDELERLLSCTSAAESNWRALLTSGPDYVLIINPDGAIRYINHLMAGFSMDEVLGSCAFDYVLAEYKDSMHTYLDEVLDSGTVRQIEVPAVTSGGETAWFSVQVGPFKESERIVAATCIATDITDRKRREQKLIADSQRLRNLLDLDKRERKLIAHDIHDGFVQDVVGAKMLLEAISDEQATQGSSHEAFGKATTLLSSAIDEARRMISELKPLIIGEQSIIQAINHLIRDDNFCQGVKVGFSHNVQFERLDSMLEGTLFRIVQEALNNIVRHSKSPTATVDLAESDGVINLEIRDEGIGMDLDNVPEDRFGVRGISERARLFGGQAEFTSGPERGTQLFVSIPRIDV